MLAREHRMRRSGEFRLGLRGRRAGRSTLVMSFVPSSEAPASSAPRVGLIVSRAVGGATTRNRVRRRLRHLIAARMDHLPSGSLLVLRALPAAATASHQALSADVDAALRRLVPPAAPGSNL